MGDRWNGGLYIGLLSKRTPDLYATEAALLTKNRLFLWTLSRSIFKLGAVNPQTLAKCFPP